jgi:hypothetical protein
MGPPISNIFELLGKDENAVTFAIGWTQRQSRRGSAVDAQERGEI